MPGSGVMSGLLLFFFFLSFKTIDGDVLSMDSTSGHGALGLPCMELLARRVVVPDWGHGTRHACSVT